MSNPSFAVGDEARSRIVQGQLSNGLRYALWPDERDSVTSLQIWLATGSSSESSGKTGLAHMLEHLMFRGTSSVPDGEFDLRMEALGAQINAATWLDFTCYESTFPPQVLSEVLSLESDRFAGLALTEEIFRTERDVVANERRQTVDADPESRLHEHFHTLAYGDACYGWPTIGWSEDIDAYELRDVTAFVERWYVPGNMLVAITGPLDEHETVRLLDRTLGELPARPRPADARRAGFKGGGFHRLRLPMSNDQLLLGFPAPARAEKTWPTWLMTRQLLAGSEAALLPLELEVKQEEVLQVHSSLNGHALPHVLNLQATLRPGVAAETVRDRILRSVRELRDRGPSEARLERALDHMRLRVASSLARTASRTEAMGQSWVTQGDPVAGFTLPEDLSRVRIDDVRDAAACMLEDTRAVALVGESESQHATEGR